MGTIILEISSTHLNILPTIKNMAELKSCSVSIDKNTIVITCDNIDDILNELEQDSNITNAIITQHTLR